MNTDLEYSIGIPGKPWGKLDKADWLHMQYIKRSYQEQVVAKLTALKQDFEVLQYGSLPYKPEQHALFVVKSPNWHKSKANVLLTGGVHGYETSGVQGALRFLQHSAQQYGEHFNILVAPCVSPWGYETINRWNPDAVDPNRSFHVGSPSPEAALLMDYVQSLNIKITAHFDLHETTDSDNSEFRPALAARDGTLHDNWDIPDGFYLVGDKEKPCADFQAAIIKAVEQVTHIAPPDANGKIIGVALEQKGVINYHKKQLGLCGGFADATYVTTTEVYPDSPKANDENCILAQVAAICGGLDYILSTEA